jgi:capsular polysaccharide biosynthesis protein
MNVHQTTHFVRRQWWVVALGAIIAVAVAALALSAWPKRYVSTTSFFVSLEAPTVGPGAAYNNTQFGQARVKSYAALATSPTLAQALFYTLNLSTPVHELQSKISARVEPETVLLDVSVRESSAARAYLLATTIDQVFPRVVRAVEGTAASSPATISLAQPATLPSAPDKPGLVSTLVIALVIGAGLGLGATAIRNRYDRRVDSGSVIAEATAAPLLGAVGHLASPPALPMTPPSSLDALRVRLALGDPASGKHVVLFAGVRGDENVAGLVVGLAAGVAASERSVCAVDGDLSRCAPSFLGMEAPAGLSDVLSGQTDLRAAVFRASGASPIQLMTAGQQCGDSISMLQSRLMTQTLAAMRRSWDVVLIESSPLLANADAASLATRVDGVVVVARHARAHVRELEAAVRSLPAGAHVLGIVVVDTPRSCGWHYLPTLPQQPEEDVLPAVTPNGHAKYSEQQRSRLV